MPHKGAEHHKKAAEHHTHSASRSRETSRGRHVREGCTSRPCCAWSARLMLGIMLMKLQSITLTSTVAPRTSRCATAV